MTRKPILAAMTALAAVSAFAAPALAQRDPAYASARAAGQVGEKPDGYLGIVGTPSPQLQDMVNDINIKRKTVYTERATAEKVTVQEYAFTAGCLAIARTTAGEKYQTPAGNWETRGAAPPVRDPRCP